MVMQGREVGVVYCVFAVVAFLAVVAALGIKIFMLKKSAREIRLEFSRRMSENTNTLVAISSRDKDMRALADDINRQLKLLREKRHRYEQGDFELKQAVVNVAHDLRTPLTAICGYLDLLGKRLESGSDEARYLGIIRERTEALKELTEELFKYSVFTTAEDNETSERVCLNGVLEESVAAYYAALNGVGITPNIVMPDAMIYRRLNKKALSRILENIIGNAIKYSDGDLEIRLFENGKMTFSNYASAFDETQTGRLFDRFYTVNSAIKSSGIGLSIAKALTEQMNGKIGAEYRNGRLEIWVEL